MSRGLTIKSRVSVLVTVASLLATTWLAAAAPVTSAESTALSLRAGATFTNTVFSFPLCCPARASLLTSQ